MTIDLDTWRTLVAFLSFGIGCVTGYVWCKIGSKK